MNVFLQVLFSCEKQRKATGRDFSLDNLKSAYFNLPPARCQTDIDGDTHEQQQANKVTSEYGGIDIHGDAQRNENKSERCQQSYDDCTEYSIEFIMSANIIHPLMYDGRILWERKY